MDSGWKLVVVRDRNVEIAKYFICEGCWENDPVVEDGETAVMAMQDIYQAQHDRCQRCGRKP